MSFGQITGSTYTSLADNTVLTSNTTLYCVTENKDTPQVVWSYVDLSDVITNLTSTTDATTGVSIIQVYTTQPGYYTCEVSHNGGMNTTTYTAVMTDTNKYTGSLLPVKHSYFIIMNSTQVKLHSHNLTHIRMLEYNKLHLRIR